MEFSAYGKECAEYNISVEKKRENTCRLSWVRDI